jgi:hypothetical protein
VPGERLPQYRAWLAAGSGKSLAMEHQAPQETVMNPDIVRKNAESRARLLGLVEQLDEQVLSLPVEEGWTITAILAHVAFWDQICAVRWDAYARGGSLVDIPNTLIDLVNDANLPTWRALPGRAAVELLRQAMEVTDAKIAVLPDAAVQAATEDGFGFMLDRTGHRDEHAAQLKTFLGE